MGYKGGFDRCIFNPKPHVIIIWPTSDHLSESPQEEISSVMIPLTVADGVQIDSKAQIML